MELAGIDIDAEKVAYFRQLWPLANLHVGDVERLNDVGLVGKFDVILAGELIEHLDNPGRFLEGVKPFMSPTSTLLITTPNGPSLKYFVHATCGNDRSHPDHSLMFSASTLTTLLSRHGFKVTRLDTSMEMFDQPRNRRSVRMLSAFFNLRPMLAETLLVEAIIDSED
jgi:hypothetical protein